MEGAISQSKSSIGPPIESTGRNNEPLIVIAMDGKMRNTPHPFQKDAGRNKHYRCFNRHHNASLILL
jgi:hypothetical protein